jgi:DNA-binding NarL/FixJ family response regulator
LRAGERFLSLLPCRPRLHETGLCGYALPLLNGIEATRQIRSRVPEAEVLTMHDTDALLRDALEAGARGFLLKSDAKRFLVAAVESLAAHHPFFTGKVSEALLGNYLSKPGETHDLLTSREKSVLQLIAEGHPNREIAKLLNISLKTVETHRSSVLKKLKVETTAGLVRYAVRNKLMEA